MCCNFGPVFLENSDRGPIEEFLSRLVVGWGKAHMAPPLFLHLPRQYHYTVTGKYEVSSPPHSSPCSTSKKSGSSTTTRPPQSCNIKSQTATTTKMEQLDTIITNKCLNVSVNSCSSPSDSNGSSLTSKPSSKSALNGSTTSSSSSTSNSTRNSPPASSTPHYHLVPSSNRVVQDVGIVTNTQDCISMILSERISANWGLMVRLWTQKNGALLEHSFPSFILHYLPLLMQPQLVQMFSQFAGLDQFDRKKMEKFNKLTEDYRKRWQWSKK